MPFTQAVLMLKNVYEIMENTPSAPEIKNIIDLLTSTTLGNTPHVKEVDKMTADLIDGLMNVRCFSSHIFIMYQFAVLTIVHRQGEVSIIQIYTGEDKRYNPQDPKVIFLFLWMGSKNR